MAQFKILFVLIFGLLLSNPCIAQQNLNYNLQQMLKNTQKEYGIQAISLSINFPGVNTIDVTSGTLSKDQLTDVNPSHLFQVASITKTFVAAIILQLESEGKLNLNDPVGAWLPQHPETISNFVK